MSVNAVNVVLEFSCTVGAFTVTADTPTGQVTVDGVGAVATVNVGTLAEVTWTIASNGKWFKGTLMLDRPPTVGVGAFKIPVLPVAVVYEPPPDASKRNFAEYQTTDATSTTVTVSVGTDNETSTPVPGAFAPLAELGSLVKAGSSAASAWGTAFATGAGGASTAAADASSVITGATAGAAAAIGGASVAAPVAGPALAALVTAVTAAASVVSGILGSSTTTQSNDVNVTQDGALTISKGTTTTFSTGGRGVGGINSGGPGKGDMIYALKGARVIWAVISGALHLSLLDWERDALIGVSDLQSGGGSASELPSDAIAALLSLDPFVAGGSSATLPEDRYTLITVREMDSSGGREDYSVSSTTASVNTSAQVYTSMTVTQDQSGWLSFLGIGVTDDDTTKVSMTNGTSTATGTAATTTASLSLFSAPTEAPYATEVYQDIIFGTFAFRTGTIANEIVTLNPSPGVGRSR